MEVGDWRRGDRNVAEEGRNREHDIGLMFSNQFVSNFGKRAFIDHQNKQNHVISFNHTDSLIRVIYFVL